MIRDGRLSRLPAAGGAHRRGADDSAACQPKVPHSAGRSRGGCPGARMGVQASSPLGLPPATDAPQVIVRKFHPVESFRLHPSRAAPQCPWEEPVSLTEHEPPTSGRTDPAARGPFWGQPCPGHLSAWSPPLPQLEGESGRIVGTSLGRPACRDTRAGPVH